MEIHDKVLVALRQIIRAIDLHSKKLERESGLTGPQLLVMQTISQAESVTAGQIARDVNLSQATVTSILDRLENETASKRLRGVFDAADVAGDDAEIARALLVRATEDRVGSVRAAAINALGPSINAPAVGQQLMPLLQQAASPIVQLALVDLVLRYGNDAQLDEVLSLARNGQLHPDLQRYVINALEGDTA